MMPPPIVGEPAPLFTLPTQRGVPKSLADVLQQGAALIAFPGRVSWTRTGADAPANRRIQALARIQAQAREAHVELLVIVPNRREDARRYVEETGTPFHLLCDDGDAARRYGVRRRGMILILRQDTGPALFGVDRDGAIRYRLLDDWDDTSPALAEALGAAKTNRPAGS